MIARTKGKPVRAFFGSTTTFHVCEMKFLSLYSQRKDQAAQSILKSFFILFVSNDAWVPYSMGGQPDEWELY